MGNSPSQSEFYPLPEAIQNQLAVSSGTFSEESHPHESPQTLEIPRQCTPAQIHIVEAQTPSPIPSPPFTLDPLIQKSPRNFSADSYPFPKSNVSSPSTTVHAATTDSDLIQCDDMIQPGYEVREDADVLKDYEDSFMTAFSDTKFCIPDPNPDQIAANPVTLHSLMEDATDNNDAKLDNASKDFTMPKDILPTPLETLIGFTEICLNEEDTSHQTFDNKSDYEETQPQFDQPMESESDTQISIDNANSRNEESPIGKMISHSHALHERKPVYENEPGSSPLSLNTIIPDPKPLCLFTSPNPKEPPPTSPVLDHQPAINPKPPLSPTVTKSFTSTSPLPIIHEQPQPGPPTMLIFGPEAQDTYNKAPMFPNLISPKSHNNNNNNNNNNSKPHRVTFTVEEAKNESLTPDPGWMVTKHEPKSLPRAEELGRMEDGEGEKQLAAFNRKIAEMKEKLDKAEEDKNTLIKEREQALEDLANVESAFGNLHSKYERQKQVLMNLKENEAKLIARDKEMRQMVEMRDQKLQLYREKSEEKLEMMYSDYDAKLHDAEAESVRLRAQVRLLEMKLKALESDVEHKTKENSQLNALCNELINGHGQRLE